MAAVTDIRVVAPKETHRYTMIFLHGRDDDPALFPESVLESETSAPKRDLPSVFPSMKWVFPASRKRESLRFKMPLIQWFDIWSVENPSEHEQIQKEGLRESISAILEIVHEESRYIPPSRIFMGGISQGCATAILALLCGEMKLGGFVGLCAWLPFQKSLVEIIRTQNAVDDEGQDTRMSLDTPRILSYRGSITSQTSHITDKVRALLGGVQQNISQNGTGAKGSDHVLATPIFLSHSANDEIVPVENGRLLRDCLETMGMDVTWKEYRDGGHWIYEPEDEEIRNGIDDIEDFVSRHSAG